MRVATLLLALLSLALGHVAQAEQGAKPAASSSGSALLNDATAFMASYADDLRQGRRAAIAGRYDRRGAFFMGDGTKQLASWAEIEARYAEKWGPPASFEWIDLSYEPAGPDSIVVAGQFKWGRADGKVLLYSYTGLLVRQEGELRIRLEDESTEP